jgi:hypothetical protein
MNRGGLSSLAGAVAASLVPTLSSPPAAFADPAS